MSRTIRDVGRRPLRFAFAFVILTAVLVFVGFPGTSAQGPEQPPDNITEIGDPTGWGMPMPTEFDSPAPPQAPIDTDDSSDSTETAADAERPAVPSISPDSIPSLEAVLAPLRAVPPAVYQSCGSAPSPRPTPTATPKPPQPTATPWVQPTPVPTRAGADNSGKPGPAKTAVKSIPTAPAVPKTPTPVRTPVPAPPPPAASAPLGCLSHSNVTFYDCLNQGFCGAMYDGTKVYEGAAACSFDLSLGTRFRITGDPTGRIYRCEDRGLLKPVWVDIFFNDPADGWAWAARVGRFSTLEIVP